MLLHRAKLLQENYPLVVLRLPPLPLPLLPPEVLEAVGYASDYLPPGAVNTA